MKTRAFLAFDFGVRRIGVAIGNDLTQTANPLTTIAATNDADRFEAVGILLADWQPDELIVGRPSHPDGEAHEMTRRCEKFARQLFGRFHLPVHLVDERYTSVEAELELAQAEGRKLTGARKKAAIDAAAAAHILRRFFDGGADHTYRSETSTP